MKRQILMAVLAVLMALPAFAAKRERLDVNQLRTKNGNVVTSTELDILSGATVTTAQLNTVTVDPGAHAVGNIDFNTTGTAAMTVTINGVAYLEANSEDADAGIWTNGSSAADSATSLILAINGDIRATVNYTAVVDLSGDGVVVYADAVGTAGNFTLASDDGTATVSAATMLGGASPAQKIQATYEMTVNATQVLAGSADIPIPFTPIGFLIQVRTSTGLVKAITDLVTIQSSPARIRVDIDGGTNIASTDVIHLIVWN